MTLTEANQEIQSLGYAIRHIDNVFEAFPIKQPTHTYRTDSLEDALKIVRLYGPTLGIPMRDVTQWLTSEV